MDIKKNLVVFDGSNFYHGAKNLSPKTHLTDFNYRVTDVAGKELEKDTFVSKYVPLPNSYLFGAGYVVPTPDAPPPEGG